MRQDISDLTRLVHNLIGLGTIAEVDHSSTPRVKVNLSGRLTDWLPYPADIGANFRRWRPLRPGTQVVVVCPSGDPANAAIVQILYTTALPAPELGDEVDVIAFEDGTIVRHDTGAKLTQVINPTGTLVLEGKNVVIRTGEGGYFQQDHSGYATRLTHQGGSAFTTESWTTGAVVTGQPDHGFSPPRVASPGEVG